MGKFKEIFATAADLIVLLRETQPSLVHVEFVIDEARRILVERDSGLFSAMGFTKNDFEFECAFAQRDTVQACARAGLAVIASHGICSKEDMTTILKATQDYYANGVAPSCLPTGHACTRFSWLDMADCLGLLCADEQTEQLVLEKMLYLVESGCVDEVLPGACAEQVVAKEFEGSNARGADVRRGEIND